ncbi:restriction endonuclease subunit S [Massilia sp. PWRC2]|uniref:restriction endonuclease subunit S n=1 Tax=Massilia sp. PWRC2 TaxID=2804626 RepID=UPI003CF81B18
MSFNSEWPVSELGKEAINASRPFSFKTHPQVVFVNTGDVLNGRFLHSTLSSGDGLPGQAKKALRQSDILLTEIRPENGRFAYVDFDVDKYVVSTKFMVIQTLGRVLPRFLYHVLTNKYALNEFQRVAESRSGTFPQITFDSISHFPVPVPPEADQIELVSFFDNLKNRIDLLQETNTTLEAIAQTLFKSWFVDFDPVHAKMEGAVPDGMDEATAALFPDGFEASEFGLVPRGWSRVPVYDLATYINGAAYKAFSPNLERRGLPIIKIAELKAGVSSQTAYSDVVMPEKYRINTADILFSWSGNPDTSIDTFVWTHGQSWLNQHIFRVLPQEEHERSFLLRTLKHLRPVFAELARNKQTTGLGHVTVADLKRLLVLKPTSLYISLGIGSVA